MNLRGYAVLLLLISWILGGCTQVNNPAPQSAEPSQTITPNATSTPFPTLTATPTQIAYSSIGTPIASARQKITTQNAASLTLFSRRGRGIPYQLVTSPDGATAAVASSRGLFFYDSKTLEETGQILPPDTLHSIAFAPSGNLVAGGNRNGRVNIWGIPDYNLLAETTMGITPIRALTFSSNNQLLGAAAWGQVLQALNSMDAGVYQSFQVRTGNVSSIAFSPDGNSFFSWAPGEQLKVWSISSGNATREIYIGPDELARPSINAGFSGDGSLFAVNYGLRVRVFRTTNSTTLSLIRETGEPVNQVYLSQDGSLLAGIKSHSVRIWNSKTGIVQADFPVPGEQPAIKQLSFTPDNLAILTISDRLQRWEITAAATPVVSRPVEYENESIYSYHFNQVNKLVEFAQLDGGMRSVNFQDGAQIGYAKLSAKTTGMVSFSPDGSFTAIVEPKGKVVIKQNSDGNIRTIFSGQKGNITSLCISADNALLASGSEENTVLIWRMQDQELLSILNLPSPPQQCIFTPDNQNLILRTAGDIYVYNLAESNINFHIPGYYFSISHDGKILAVSSKQEGKDLVTIFNLDNETIDEVIDEPSNNISFSPDDTIMVTVGDKIKLWDLATSKIIHSLENSNQAGPVIFSDDGKYLIQLGWDGAYDIWGIP